MKVAKFGGTSVGTASALQRTLRLIQLLAEQNNQLVVVISALSQVTNQLTAIYEDAVAGHNPENELTALWQRHQELASFFQADQATLTKMALLMQHLRADVAELASRATLCERSFARILAYGELLSSTLVADLVIKAGLPATWVDARSLIKTDNHYRAAMVEEELTNQLIQTHLLPLITTGQVVVTQGFIASTCNEGKTSLLGREGSDYSAALLGAALSAAEIQIWTDVDGFMTGDPRYIHNAELIHKLSYEEAGNLARFGAKVLHPATFAPAEKQQIPIKILNSSVVDLTQLGTLITTTPSEEKQRRIAFKTEVTLLSFTDDTSFQHFLTEEISTFGSGALWVVDSKAKVAVVVPENKEQLHSQIRSAQIQELAAIYLQNFPYKYSVPPEVNYQFAVPGGRLWLVAKENWQRVGAWAHDVR